MLSAIMLNVANNPFMLSVVMLSVVMLCVLAPFFTIAMIVLRDLAETDKNPK